jgi:hypothetical protein
VSHTTGPMATVAVAGKLRDFIAECFLPLSPECSCVAVKNSARLKGITAESEQQEWGKGRGGVCCFVHRQFASRHTLSLSERR